MAIFALRMVNGPRWDDAKIRREQTRWAEHAAFMDGLVADGSVVLGGPIGDGSDVLLVMHAAHEGEVRAKLAADPWIQDRILDIGSLEPWTIWLDGTKR